MSTDTPHIPPELRDRLRKESPEERADLEAVWDLLGTAKGTAGEAADPEAAWADLAERHPELAPTPENGEPDPADPEATSRREQRPARRPQHRRSPQWAWGLAVAVVVLVGGLWLWQRPVTVTAPAGQQQTVSLPDGSTVELNSGTTLTYRRAFQSWPFVDAQQRVVRLDGEAFFEVVEGARPFEVKTTTAQVSVVGTRFNVTARTAGKTGTKVTVVQGRVRVAPRTQPTDTVVLSKPGYMSHVAAASSSPTAPQPAPVDHILAWRDEGFAVHARPLSAVIQALERRYDKVLRLHPSVRRPDAPVSLYYPTPTDLETILHDLCTARDLNYRPTSRGFEIFAGSNGP
ncbi:MAG: FecR family protein [Salinibacter sp.]|uniref:FecR family protein n=1 Tax=Salinibacter sp. TaxID=2065818 RepID=UPI0035D50412